MTAKVPQTLDYMGGQLNVSPILEVENFTNWNKRFMCHIIVFEPLFKSVIQNGLYVLMTADDQMNFVINYEIAKSTWDDLILYHEGPSDVKESRFIDLKLCYNTFKFKEDSPNDEEDTRSSQEYMKDLDEEFHERALLAKSKRFFKKGTQRFSGAKATDHTECHKCDFEAKYNKGKAKLAFLSYGASTSKSSQVRNQGVVAEAYEWDKEEVSSDANEMVEVNVLMALTDDESGVVGKESAGMINGLRSS
nr:hypothetical protein [Tanacetum cinerariifolium]